MTLYTRQISKITIRNISSTLTSATVPFLRFCQYAAQLLDLFLPLLRLSLHQTAKLSLREWNLREDADASKQ